MLDPLPISPAASLAQTLKRLRERARISPTRLARDAGVSRATIYNLECGANQNPEPATLRRIANALPPVEQSYRQLMDAAGYKVKNTPAIDEGVPSEYPSVRVSVHRGVDRIEVEVTGYAPEDCERITRSVLAALDATDPH